MSEYSLDSAHFHDHLDRRQRCLNVLHMRWPNRHGNDTDVQTAIECGDEFNAGREDERHVVTTVQLTFLQKQTGDLLGLLVQLGTGELLHFLTLDK